LSPRAGEANYVVYHLLIDGSEQRQAALKEQGLVVMTQQWSKETKPSVTVRL
jgi:hypothetical protein